MKTVSTRYSVQQIREDFLLYNNRILLYGPPECLLLLQRRSSIVKTHLSTHRPTSLTALKLTSMGSSAVVFS